MLLLLRIWPTGLITYTIYMCKSEVVYIAQLISIFSQQQTKSGPVLHWCTTMTHKWCIYTFPELTIKWTHSVIIGTHSVIIESQRRKIRNLTDIPVEALLSSRDNQSELEPGTVSNPKKYLGPNLWVPHSHNVIVLSKFKVGAFFAVTSACSLSFCSVAIPALRFRQSFSLCPGFWQ